MENNMYIDRLKSYSEEELQDRNKYLKISDEIKDIYPKESKIFKALGEEEESHKRLIDIIIKEHINNA